MSILKSLGYIGQSVPNILHETLVEVLQTKDAPNWMDLSKVWVQKKTRACKCFERNNMSTSETEDIVFFWFKTFKRNPSCHAIIYVFFYMAENKGHFPSLAHVLKANEDGSLFEKNKIMSRKRKMLEVLPIEVTKTSGMCCALCQEDIEIFAPVFKMPCCKQIFHASRKECLDQTVLDWFQTSERCPTCNKKNKL